MELQKKNQGLPIIEQFAKELFKLNYIVPYSYSDSMLIGMAQTIVRLSPNTNVNKLSKLIDAYIIEDEIFDVKKGLSNIFRDLKTFTTKEEKEELQLQKMRYIHGEDYGK